MKRSTVFNITTKMKGLTAREREQVIKALREYKQKREIKVVVYILTILGLLLLKNVDLEWRKNLIFAFIIIIQTAGMLN